MQSSPIRFRACFTTTLTPDEVAARFTPYPEAEPLTGPGWFDCYDADAIGDALVDVVEAAAAVLRRVVEAAAAAVLGVNVLRQPPAEARAEQAGLEFERRVDDRRDDAGDRQVEEATGKRAARALHHRLEAVAARARDAQREAHAADEGDGLDD